MDRTLVDMLSNSVYIPIKTEPQPPSLRLCDGCLSNDRILAPVGKLRDLFFRILDHDEQDNMLGVSLLWPQEPHLCWECRRVLRNAQRFQLRVLEAQRSLQLAAPTCGFTPAPLSTLAPVFRDVYDYHFTSTVDTVTKSEPDDLGSNDNYDEFEYKPAEYTPCHVEISEFDGYGGRKPSSHVRESKAEVKREPPPKRKRKRCLKPKSEENDGEAENNMFTVIYTSKTEWEDDRRRKAEREAYNSAEYKCEKCIVVFRKERLLQSHNLAMHDASNPHKCSICPAQLPTERKLRHHERTHCYYKCNMCNYNTARLDYLYSHYENHHTHTIQCKECDEIFPNRRLLDSHTREKHTAFVCDHCGKLARTKPAIARHILNYHMPMFCAPCNQTFKNARMMAAHNKLKHEQVKTEARYCVECDVTFDTGGLYTQHVKTHHGKQFPCPKCKKTYKTKWHMKAHHSYFHERRTQHYCAECDKYFIRKFALQRHERRVHQQVRIAYPKKHICEHCSRGFAWIRDLIQHVRTHTGERPHACAHCPARFAQESPLVTHVRRVHGVQGGFREILEQNDLSCLAESGII